jgi:transglutaminase-like putative cysteine protease
MHLVISHSTTYRFDEPVRYGLQELRLRPRDQPGQRVIRWDTEIEGGASEAVFEDQFSNSVELVSIDADVTATTVTASGEVETTDTAGITPRHTGYAPLWLFRRSTPLTTPGPAIKQLCRSLSISDPIVDLHNLAALILNQVAYEPGRTDAESTAEDVLDAGQGVCQDHSHVFITAARLLGFPARYVSGYLLLDNSIDQDASHAWSDVWIDGLGWVGFDVSNGISPDGRYVRIATGLDYRAAAPVSGVRFGTGHESLRVDVRVTDEGSGVQQ